MFALEKKKPHMLSDDTHSLLLDFFFFLFIFCLLFDIKLNKKFNKTLSELPSFISNDILQNFL